MFDRLQDGEATYSDGTPIEALMPLRDRPLPPQRDDLHPGSDDDPGAMGINYRCEPMVERWSRPERQAVVGEEVVREMSWMRCVQSV